MVALSSDGSLNTEYNTIVLNNNKGKEKLPMCKKEDNEHVNEFQLEPSMKKTKKTYKASRKFQDTWAVRLPWVELYWRSNGLYESVKYLVCLLIKGKDKILDPK